MKKLFIILIWITCSLPLWGQTWQLEWQNCFGGSDEDYATDIVPYGANYIVVGASASSDGDITGNHGKGDGWVLELDPVGSMIWQKSFGGTDGEHWKRIVPTVDHHFYLVGVSNSSDNDIWDDPYPESLDFWIVKIDSTGEILWSKILV